MGSTGGTNNPLAAIPHGATINLVLDGVDLSIENETWVSNSQLKVTTSDDTWTIAHDDDGRSFYPGTIPPCSIQSIVANKSQFSMTGPVVRPGAYMHVKATQSTVALLLNDEDEYGRMDCFLHDQSEFLLSGTVRGLTVDANFSQAVLNVRCDTMHIFAVSSVITGAQVTDSAFLTLSDSSALKKLYVHRYVDFNRTGASVDAYVDSVCTIENPPEWTSFATALTKMPVADAAGNVEGK